MRIRMFSQIANIMLYCLFIFFWILVGLVLWVKISWQTFVNGCIYWWCTTLEGMRDLIRSQPVYEIQYYGKTFRMNAAQVAKAWRFVRERFRSYQTELKSRGIKRARARRDANRERQDIVTLVKRQLTREISEGRFTANREAVKREVERRVKERMILSRNRNYSRLATDSP
ncbi:TPA: hypothetical protein HIQ47_004285 [Escherichia coli]|nr:hypothetical protein [Escherichia coli]HAH9213468.1 hypothetical protein [Escherichia coli]